MGNCLVIQDRREMIKIMRMDGGILKLPSPLKAREALAEFPPGHGVSDALPAQQHGLFPVKALAVADPGVVRVKLVISKQELKKMLNKEAISLDDMMSVSLMRKEANDEQEMSCRGWRPALQSIPEGSDF